MGEKKDERQSYRTSWNPEVKTVENKTHGQKGTTETKTEASSYTKALLQGGTTSSAALNSPTILPTQAL